MRETGSVMVVMSVSEERDWECDGSDELFSGSDNGKGIGGECGK